MISRRALLASLAALAVPGGSIGTGARGADLAGKLAELRPTLEDGVAVFDLSARQASLPLLGPDGPRSPVWLYSDTLFPVMRLKRVNKWSGKNLTHCSVFVNPPLAVIKPFCAILVKRILVIASSVIIA